MDEKDFCLDGPDNISPYVEHTGDSVIAPHRFKRQMGGGGVMFLGSISNFSNLLIKVIAGKYNSLKYLDDLQITFILPMDDNWASTNGFGSMTMRVSTLKKKVSEYLNPNKMAVFIWPEHKPDLNIIENVWQLMEEVEYSDKQYNDRKELIRALERCTKKFN